MSKRRVLKRDYLPPRKLKTPEFYPERLSNEESPLESLVLQKFELKLKNFFIISLLKKKREKKIKSQSNFGLYRKDVYLV